MATEGRESSASGVVGGQSGRGQACRLGPRGQQAKPFGGLFVLFVPNIAEHFSKGLAGAVYGLILILVIYLMPSGAAGLVKLVVNKLARKKTAS